MCLWYQLHRFPCVHVICHAIKVGVSVRLLLQECDTLDKLRSQVNDLCSGERPTLLHDDHRANVAQPDLVDTACTLRMAPFKMRQSGRPRKNDRFKTAKEKLLGKKKRKKKRRNPPSTDEDGSKKKKKKASPPPGGGV